MLISFTNCRNEAVDVFLPHNGQLVLDERVIDNDDFFHDDSIM